MPQENRESALSKLEALLSGRLPAKPPSGSGPKFEELQSLLSPEQGIFREIKRQMGGSFSGQNLLLCDPSNNKDAMAALTKLALEDGKTPVLVLSAMNYKLALAMLDDAKISRKGVFVIDTVSKGIMKVQETDRVSFIDSPRNLTQIEIMVFKLLEGQPDSCFIFDSLDILQLYHEDEVIGKFVYALTKLLHKHKRVAFYLLNRKSLLSKLNQFADTALQLKKV